MGVLALLVTLATSGCARLSQPVASAGLVRTLSGHRLWVNSLTWAPDGTRLASGSSDRTVRVWDATNGTTLTTLTGFAGGVNVVAWSPNGQYLATGAAQRNNGLQVWSTMTWQPVFGIDPTANAPNDAGLNSLAWSPDSTLLAVGLEGTTTKGVPVKSWAKVYAAANWHNTATLTYTDGIASVAWSPQGKTLAIASSYYHFASLGRVVLWDPTADSVSDTPTVKFPEQNGLLTVLAWDPDGRRIAGNALTLATPAGYSLTVWDVAHQQRSADLAGAAETVKSVAWSADGAYIAAGADDRTVTVWNAGSGRQVATYQAGDAVNSVAWSPNSSLLAAGCADGNIYLWARPAAPTPGGPSPPPSP